MSLPSWSRELIDLYESGVGSQFLLHGNVADRILIAGKDSARFGSLDEFLNEVLLSRFDVVLSFDLGNGLRVEKGGEVFKEWPSFRERALPRAPREAVEIITHYLRFAANAARVAGGRKIAVACVLRAANLVVPQLDGGLSYDLNAIASLIREWASDPLITGHHAATFLIAENLSEMHPLIVNHSRAARIAIPLPDAPAIEDALRLLARSAPDALSAWKDSFSEPAAALTGATLQAVEKMVTLRQHKKSPITPADLAQMKKELVERDCEGLIDFIKPDRTLHDLHGQDGLKRWIRQDIALWQQGDLAALPMGYLICGPVGTGKTFMVECIAGEAGVPVVKLKNFRDRWVGSTEGNLEKIFRLLAALGRCMVFVDEADQALGRRSAESGDSGVSGRVYSMMAEQMSDTRNRGKIIWVLATSRPDLVEVDLKRPGRVDVKIPLFPTSTPEEGWKLLRALCKRRGLALPETPEAGFPVPDLLTPGAAEALSVKAYRLHKTESLDPLAAVSRALADYQPPVPLAVLEKQIQLAVEESTDLSFVPERFRRQGLAMER